MRSQHQSTKAARTLDRSIRPDMRKRLANRRNGGLRKGLMLLLLTSAAYLSWGHGALGLAVLALGYLAFEGVLAGALKCLATLVGAAASRGGS